MHLSLPPSALPHCAALPFSLTHIPTMLSLRTTLRAAARSSTNGARFLSQAAARTAPDAGSANAPAGVPNPDPTEESASGQLVREHAPYMVTTYARPPPVFVKGAGSYLWDIENRKFLDFTAGIAVNSLGHCDPTFSQLIAEQVSQLSLAPFTSTNKGYD